MMRDTDSDFATERHDDRRKQGPEANTHDIEKTDIERPRQFAVAAASLRQAWRELPEIHEISDNLIVEETPEGLHIQLVDQEGRSMFPSGSPEPFARTKTILAKMAPVLKALPNRISITGHTDASRLYDTSRVIRCGICPPTAPSRLGRSLPPTACRTIASSRSPDARTPSRCFLRIRSWRRTGASPS